MKQIAIFLLGAMMAAGCRVKDHCPDFYPVAATDKAKYQQDDPVHLQILYSDRASYNLVIGAEKIHLDKGECVVKKARYLLGRNIECESIIGNCVKHNYLSIPIDYVPIPTCPLIDNCFNFGTTSLTLANASYDGGQKIFNLTLTGTGTVSGDNLKVYMPSGFDVSDSLVGYYIGGAPANPNAGFDFNYQGQYYHPEPKGYILTWRRFHGYAILQCCLFTATNSGPAAAGFFSARIPL
jgi:hypothetical protein